jgi:hypothetical protein
MREVVITPRAQKELNQLFEYFELEWSIKVKNDFTFSFKYCC